MDRDSGHYKHLFAVTYNNSQYKNKEYLNYNKCIKQRKTCYSSFVNECTCYIDEEEIVPMYFDEILLFL